MATRATQGKPDPAITGRGAGFVHPRRPWIDNLKVLLITTIIAMHGVLSYAGTVEVWTYTEYREVTLHPVTEGVLFILVAPFGFFMIALLFLVAGLLTPGSVAHKGPGRFAVDRLLRLGAPFAVFVLLLEPTLTYLLEHPLGDAPGTWAQEYLGAEKALDTGPLWFVGVLLIYSLVFAAWVALRGRNRRQWTRITFSGLLMTAGLVAAGSFLVRLVYPYGSEAGRSDLNLWEWPACIAAFGLGVVAWRAGWLEQVPEHLQRQCRRVTLLALGAMAALLVVAGLTDRVPDAMGGWNVLAATFAMVEAPLTIFGPVWLLAVAQRRLDSRYRGDAILNRTCYAAFIVQGFVLIAAAYALRGVAAPAEVKALVVAVTGWSVPVQWHGCSFGSREWAGSCSRASPQRGRPGPPDRPRLHEVARLRTSGPLSEGSRAETGQIPFVWVIHPIRDSIAPVLDPDQFRPAPR